MNNIQEITITNYGVEDTYIIIDRGNEEYTSMLKADYDAQQAASTLPSNSSIPQAGE